MTLPQYDWLRARVIDSDAGRESMAKAERIVGLARELGMPPAQLAIAWCLKNPHVSSVILGATSERQIAENLGALEHVSSLTEEVMERIEGVLGNRPELPQRD
jgi:aryl-alcohol dehydrogenase-like predicted oxidoreductase